MKKATTPRPSRYYSAKEVPVPVRHRDGTYSYTFTEAQKQLLFGALSHYGNIIATGGNSTNLTPREIRSLRALREGF